jgi:uncharacterized protein (DUF2147 family)
MKSVAIVILALLSLGMHPQSMDADKIVGHWISPKKDLIVKCYRGTDGKYHGKLVWFKLYPGEVERYKCDVPQNEWIGKIVLSGFRYTNNEWNGGSIKDLKKCNNYDAFIKMEKDGKLTATGFVVFRWLSESMAFSKYNGTLPIQE